MNIDLVQGQLEAYNSFDLHKFCSFYHSDISVKDFKTQTILFEGISTFQDIYKVLFQKYPEQKCELKSRVVISDFVIDEEFITGRPEFKDGKSVVAIYGFRDGLIDRVWFLG